ncbi:MAG TPA: short-chain dehydrogenase/reductase [Acidimicrobiales bacterium]|jgi:NAD(P)-dependent dehydrogenase (short-subunit alcohol dehydrogenase family)|nr:short-chain dehydrogenase/reductase [Acidimicrobiales bacterium]
MDLRLTGKRAVITGGSKGIGLGCAIGLAREGCHVQLAARNDETLLQARASVLEAATNVEVVTHSVDLSVSEDQMALVGAVGDVDIWINNAGAIPAGDIATVDERRWREAWDLKVFGYINLCREVYAVMEAKGSGVIINVIGAAAIRPQPSYIAGAVGNSGLVGLTTALGSRSLQKGVRVLGINPGLIITDRMGDILRREAVDQLGDEDRWEELIPVDPAPGTVEQCADVITFLASPRASHISGTTLTVDAGASAR